MGRCCDSAAAPATFGDGQTQFFFEARCPKFILPSAPNQLCKGCRKDSKNGRIDQLIPETSEIFGATTWFLDMVKRYGPPSKDLFKKGVEAHKQVIGSMAPSKKVVEPLCVSFIELDECIEIKEVCSVKLKPMKSLKKKQILKDEINGYLFEKLNDGTLTLVSDPSQAKATTQERVVQEAH